MPVGCLLSPPLRYPMAFPQSTSVPKKEAFTVKSKRTRPRTMAVPPMPISQADARLLTRTTPLTCYNPTHACDKVNLLHDGCLIHDPSSITYQTKLDLITNSQIFSCSGPRFCQTLDHSLLYLWSRVQWFVLLLSRRSHALSISPV